MTINWIGEALDTIFSLSGKYGRWLNVKGKKACFIIWAICVLYWCGRNIYVGLYAQSLFCLVSFGFHVYGYINWKNKGIGSV
jgi:hypothetical protein